MDQRGNAPLTVIHEDKFSRETTTKFHGHGEKTTRRDPDAGYLNQSNHSDMPHLQT